MALLIRPLTASWKQAAIDVVNEAASWYQEIVPHDELKAQEMTSERWDVEAKRLTWYGAFLDDGLAGVMGLELKEDAALLRHAYVLSGAQRKGVASRLNMHLEAQAKNQGVSRVIVATYSTNHKARAVLEKAGYRASNNSEAVLKKYYAVPETRIRLSLAYEKAI
jgi:GNAT superfamily N-acetyltransferase